MKRFALGVVAAFAAIALYWGPVRAGSEIDASTPDDVAQKALQACIEKAEGAPRDECRERLLVEWSDPANPMNEANLRRLTSSVIAACKEGGFADCAEAKVAKEPELVRQIVATRAYHANLERNEKRDAQRQSRALVACQRAGIKAGSVRIGMTTQQVKECGWGVPNEINRTVTAKRVSEQWVYSGRSYLYFDNGKLFAIQD